MLLDLAQQRKRLRVLVERLLRRGAALNDLLKPGAAILVGIGDVVVELLPQLERRLQLGAGRGDRRRERLGDCLTELRLGETQFLFAAALGVVAARVRPARLRLALVERERRGRARLLGGLLALAPGNRDPGRDPANDNHATHNGERHP